MGVWQPDLFWNPDPDLTESYKKIDLIWSNLDEAVKTNDSLVLFERSGLEIIANCIDKRLGCEELTYYFEFSSVAGKTGYSDTVNDFIFLNGDWDPEEFQKAFGNVVSFLQKEDLMTYLHKEFFRKPSGAKAICSISPVDLSSCKQIYSNKENFTSAFEEHRRDASHDRDIQIPPFKKLSHRTKSWLTVSEVEIQDLDRDFTKEEENPDILLERHKLCHHLFQKILNEKKDNEKKAKSVFMSIPIVGSAMDYEHKSLSGQGAVFVFVILNDANSNKAVTKGLIEKLVKEISDTCKDMFLPYLHDSARMMVNEALTHSMKSSISAIMSRNGSHNIGSHVINRVVENINSLNIQDHSYFFRYLQQRMDFIAQISTEFPGWSTSHWLIKEIMRDFYSQRHLLNYIAASEGLRAYEGVDNSRLEKINCIINNVKKHDCKHGLQQENKSRKNRVTGEFCSIDHNSCLDCDILNDPQVLVCNLDNCDADPNCKADLSGDVQVAIPGGMIGFHAFFTILENFIRNSAKHCYAPHPQKTEHMLININVWNYENVFRHYTIRMRDNYSYVSGLVDKDIVGKEEDLRGKKITILSQNNEIADNILSQIKCYASCIQFALIKGFDIPRDIKDADVIFIVDDGSIYRDGGGKYKYEDLARNKKVRFVEEAYWDFFLSKYSETRALKPDDLIEFLQKYYEPAHIKINRKIMNSLINMDGSLRKSDWGLAEMKISAGYLNGEGIKEIGAEGKENFDNLIKAIALPERDSEGKIKAYRLGYEFKIRKPVDVLLIGWGCKDDQTSNLKRAGILPIDRHEAEKYSAEMAVIYDSADNNDKLLSLLKENGDKKEEIKREIEKYSGRLFIATDNDNFLGDKDSFLRKRIVIVKKDDFDKWINVSEKNSAEYKKFKNRLLNRWLLHVKKEIRSEENAIDLIIQPKEELLSEENQRHEETDTSSYLLRLIGLLNVLEKKNLVDKGEKDLLIQDITKAEIYDIESLRKKINRPAKSFLRTSGDDILKKLNVFFKGINKIYGIGEGEDYLPPALPNVFKEEKGTDDASKKFEQCSPDLLEGIIGQIMKKEKDGKNKIIRYQRHRAVYAPKKDFDYLYRENLGGGAMHFHLFSHPPGWIEQTVFNLIENGLLRIGIADERVAGSGVLKTDDYYKDLKAAGIVFIKSFFGFELDYVYGNKEEYIRIENAGENKKSFIDILIVHQGILDKITNMSKDKIEEELSNLKEKIPFIFVTSGRGRPDEVPDGVKFVPFGIIESTLLQRPHSKLLLIKQLLGGINA